MKVIFRNIITKEVFIKEYPRKDLQPIIGLSDDIEIFGVVDGKKPFFDSRTHYLKLNEEWLYEPFNGLEHINTYKKTYSLEKLSNNIIIENLNESVGNWIDSKYPFWEQNKHTGQILRLQIQKDIGNWDEYDIARYEWILNTANWARDCRLERDRREKELVENDIIPSFNWDERPIKPEILNNNTN